MSKILVHIMAVMLVGTLCYILLSPSNEFYEVRSQAIVNISEGKINLLGDMLNNDGVFDKETAAEIFMGDVSSEDNLSHIIRKYYHITPEISVSISGELFKMHNKLFSLLKKEPVLFYCFMRDDKRNLKTFYYVHKIILTKNNPRKTLGVQGVEYQREWQDKRGLKENSIIFTVCPEYMKIYPEETIIGGRNILDIIGISPNGSFINKNTEYEFFKRLSEIEPKIMQSKKIADIINNHIEE